MGTNYYLHSPGGKKRHIGKSSGGWCFSLHVGDGDPDDLADWNTLIRRTLRRGGSIRDEYGVSLSHAELLQVIMNREWPSDHRWTPGDYKKNRAEPGPNGLVRSKIDGEYCIGHGDTWDLIRGMFS